LPAYKFIQRVNGDTIHYVYSDPSVCRCLYVGSQAAYTKYQEDKQTTRQDKDLEHELASNQHAAEDDDFNAPVYSDPYWNWSAWRMGSRIWLRTWTWLVILRMIA
jgi:hypothetical protein